VIGDDFFFCSGRICPYWYIDSTNEFPSNLRRILTPGRSEGSQRSGFAG
jgi:hypothetical protein